MTSEWRDKWALVTGASAGIGVALARELAAGGTHLVLTARRKERLVDLSNELSTKHGVKTEVFVADLAQPGAPEQIFGFTKEKGIEIDLLINNAGFGRYGEFPSVEKQPLLDMVQVNCAAVVHLTRLYLPEMVARRRGDVLILASTASFQAVPYISTYAATKAFVLSFSEALWEENRPYGIKVMALCPGVTETGFFVASQMKKPPARFIQTSEDVVETALRGLKRGQSSIISGWPNLLMIEMERIVPRSLILRVAGMALRNYSEKG